MKHTTLLLTLLIGSMSTTFTRPLRKQPKQLAQQTDITRTTPLSPYELEQTDENTLASDMEERFGDIQPNSASDSPEGAENGQSN
jgi:hypothetical protein